MGLLSFLSRKSSPDGLQHDTGIITQSYQNTTALFPPVRGEYPIGGNGKRPLESLMQYHAFGQSQLRLDISSPAEEPAPAPVVPTFRDDIVERPGTAPNGRSLAGNQPNTSKTRLRRSYLSGQPPLSSSKSEQGSLRAAYPPGHLQWTDHVRSLPPVEAYRHPVIARQRSNPSLRASGRGFKDILDARSELKPLDFKSRIKASGARDYGEDVADRNIGENGHNLELPQVQAFYAKATDADLLDKSKCVPMANMSSPYRRDAAVLQPRITKPHPIDPGLRTKSLNSSSAHAYQHQRAVHVSQHSPAEAPGIRHTSDQRPTTSDAVPYHQLLNAYDARDASPESTSERSRVRRLAYRGGPPLHFSPLRNALDMSVDGSGVGSPKHRLTSPPLLKQKPDVGSQDASKDNKETAIPADWKNEPAHQVHAHSDEHDARPPSSQRSFALKPSTKRHSHTAPSVASTSKGYHTHSVKPSAASSIASNHTAIDTTAPTQRHQGHSVKAARRLSLPAGISKADIDVGAVENAPSPCINGGAARYGSSNARDNHERTKSLTSSLMRLNMEELTEAIPPRTSSLRNWSISSATPTTSDTSSNPFPRPQSQNTATTSVDLGKDFVIKNTSQLSIGDVPTLRSPKKSIAFNIDDYVSSDDDSIEPRLPRGEGEEDLLFSTAGYGTSFQLPGLFDALASSPPRGQMAVADDPFLSRPRSSASLPPGAGYFHRPFGGLPGSLSPRKRYILDTAADYDDDDEDDNDTTQSWGHGGEAYTTSSALSSPGRGGVGVGVRHTKRLSALGSHHYPQAHAHAHPAQQPDVIEEERDMSKIDVAAAVRQRKEGKARKRAAAAAEKRRLLKGKGKELAATTTAGVQADEGGRRADVEC